VDGGTGSASEQFAAVLQDNKAAVIFGAPTAGAGCGHTNGGTPTTLTHSEGILELPDCARIRRDGSNEVGGIDPDILIGFRTTDGMRRKGLRVAPALSQGVAAAVQLCRREGCSRAQHR
jgi:C-terminal processing protease CtpA/Prc